MKIVAIAAAALVLASPLLLAQPVEQAGHAPDGGSAIMVQSILVPALRGAPFTATVYATFNRKAQDGSDIATWNSRLLMRDSAGRIFQERRLFLPKGSPHQPPLMRTELSDPARHEKYFCFPDRKTCELYDYNSPPAVAGEGPGDNLESLGTDTIEGLEAVGERETRPIDPGKVGNEAQLYVIKEFWYSKQLGINLRVHRDDPRFGEQDFQVSDITLGEPNAKFFMLPQGYKIIDQRVQKTAGSR